ncbi:MAG: TetR/AcrR family transcriptional regulator [Clostridia bacterium]|nr:TetR/AcrR family transcriptional regulator [Clostridia bacterium]
MDKKEQICKAAIQLFNQNGFDKTPTSQIAKEAGVAIGTLFHHFKTKEELINSLYLRCKESMISRSLKGADQEKAYLSKIRRIYKNYLQWGMDCTDEFLFFQQFGYSVYIYDKTKEEGRNKFEVFLELLKEGMEKEFIKNTSIDYLLAVSTAIMMANMNYFIQNRVKIEDENFVEETFNALWNSIRR